MKDRNGLRVLRGGSTRTPEEEFESLYRDSFRLVYNYVYYRVLDTAAAEDITAEAFLKAARAFDRYDSARAKFSTWVMSIARNCVSDYYARCRKTDNLDDHPEACGSYEQHIPVLDDDAQFAESLLRVLEDDERELVFMKYYEDKRNVDIANELGINASTVATKLSRCLAKMRKHAERGA